MNQFDLNELETKEKKQNILFTDKEEKLADKLKQICNDNGQETKPAKSAKLLHELGHIYHKRSQLQHDNSISIMMNLIKSAALYNAAITRSHQNFLKVTNRIKTFSKMLLRFPQNVDKFQTDLKQLCVDILNFADAEQTNADLIQEAEKVKVKIQSMRNFVNENILKGTDKNLSTNQEQEKINHIKSLQNKITETYTQIMADLSQYCEEVMGEPPCKFTVVGMGSIARKEITPYSDFEHIIVLEELSEQGTKNKNVLNYFRWFSVIFQTVVLNLQETILPSVSVFLLNDKESKHGDWFYDAFTTRGISFDGMMPHACKFPLGRQQFTKDKPWKTELIKPVSEMVKYLTTEEDLKNGYHLKDILTKSCFVYGDKTIFDDFESHLHKIIEEDDENIQNDTIKQQLLQDLENFAARNTLLELLQSKKFNLKRVMYRTTTLFISALGRAYNIQAISSFDIIEQLAEKNKISENAKHRLVYAVAIACELRLKWYMKCQRQNDVIKSDTGNDTAIKMLLQITSKDNIISYFRTAYALQCDISKRFKLDKKYFYSNPTLFSSSLYYGLGEKQKCIALTQDYREINENQKTRLFTFDDSMKQFHLNEKKIVSRTQQISSIESEKLQSDITSIAEYFKNFGKYLLDINKYDEAIEYFQKEETILQKILNNLSSIETTLSESNFKEHQKIDKKSTTNVYTNSFQRSTGGYSKNNTYKNKQLLQLSNCQQNIGWCLMKKNQLTEALDYLKQSLTVYERISQSVDLDPNISKTLHYIGLCFIEMNQLTEALDYLKRSLAIYEQISLGADKDPNISKALHNIGGCLIEMNQLTEALDYLKQSLAIYERISLGVDSDPNISATLHNIGCCLIKMHQLTEALDYLKRSLAINEQISLGVDSDPNISKTLHNIGCCLIEMNQLTEAMDYLKRSLATKERISLDVNSDPNISKTLRKIGWCLIKMNQRFEALDYLKRSLAIYKQISLGVDSDPNIAETLHSIGLCFIEMNQLTEALDYLKRSLAIKEQISLGAESDLSISATLHEIGRCLIEMNELNQALDYLKRSLAIRERISLGVYLDPNIAETLHSIGWCLIKMNQLTEAVNYLKRSLAIKERI